MKLIRALKVRCYAGMVAADLAMLRPATAPDSVAAATSAIFAADTEVVATLRGGRCIAGELHQTGN